MSSVYGTTTHRMEQSKPLIWKVSVFTRAHEQLLNLHSSEVHLKVSNGGNNNYIEIASDCEVESSE